MYLRQRWSKLLYPKFSVSLHTDIIVVCRPEKVTANDQYMIVHNNNNDRLTNGLEAQCWSRIWLP